MMSCAISGGDDDDRPTSITVEASSEGFVDVTLQCIGMPDVLFYLDARQARVLAAALWAGAQLADIEALD
jgi:hypothetical protein